MIDKTVSEIVKNKKENISFALITSRVIQRVIQFDLLCDGFICHQFMR